MAVNSVANAGQSHPGNIAQKIISLEHQLLDMGIPEEEVHRVLISMFENPTPEAEDFPGPITGIDLAGNQPRFLVPDTGFPPVFSQNPISSSEFIPGVGPHGFLSLPTPDPLGDVQTNNPIYDLNGSNLGHTYNITYFPATTTGTNVTNWLGGSSNYNSQTPTIGVTGFNFDKAIPEWRYNVEQSQAAPDNNNSIAIYPSGAIKEAIQKIRHDFSWLDDNYLESAKKIADATDSKVYLIRAAEETLTDHRAEGEPYLRKLSGDELQMMTRTAVNKGTDINHLGPDYKTEGMVVDAEYDPSLKQLQFLVIESDPEIIDAIDKGLITDVSINGGAPRSETIEPCNHNCTGKDCQLCNVPRGVILGELDDIAFTWVANQPLFWRGRYVDAATPGVKTTAIEPI